MKEALPLGPYPLASLLRMAIMPAKWLHGGRRQHCHKQQLVQWEGKRRCSLWHPSRSPYSEAFFTELEFDAFFQSFLLISVVK